MPRGWDATRLRILRRDPLCTLGGPSCAGASTEVDHLQPGIEEDWNLRGVCAPCHRRRTQAQSAGR